MIEPFRLEPLLPPSAMKTFSVHTPLSTHFRKASCHEVDCIHYLAGWRTVVDESTDLGKRQAGYIRTKSGRAFTESCQPTGLTEFLFKPGQKCFGVHNVKTDREAIYVVKDGDWRGNPRQTDPVKLNSIDWVDSFSNHQDRLATRFEKG
jgi:hypothetical protein